MSSENRLIELVKQLKENEQKLLNNQFKDDWDKKFAEIMVKAAQEGIIAVVRNVYK